MQSMFVFIEIGVYFSSCLMHVSVLKMQAADIFVCHAIFSNQGVSGGDIVGSEANHSFP